MQETVNCPSCSAPLAIAPDQEEVSCGFCGADFKISREDDRVDLIVLSQPGPQKEALTQQSDDVLKTVIEESSAQAEPPTESVDIPPESQATVSIPEPTSLESFEPAPTLVEQPSAPAVSATRVYDMPDNAAIPAAGPIDIIDPDQTRPAAAAQPVINYSQGAYNESALPQTTASRNRWLPISLAVFAVVCLLCACMAGIYMVFSINSAGMF